MKKIFITFLTITFFCFGFQVKADKPFPAPTSLGATAVSISQINLSWTDNSSDEAGFSIELSTDGSNFTEIATVGSDVTTYSNTGLTPNTTYYYQVRAFKLKKGVYTYSTYSNIDSDTTFTALPDAPTTLSATAVSVSQISLAWTDSADNEDGFKIERSTNGVDFTQIDTVSANVTSYDNTALNSNTTYYYKVRAYNSYGDSAYTNTDSDTTLNIEPVAIAGEDINVIDTDGDGYALVTLDASSSYDPDGYILFYEWDDIYGPIVETTSSSSVQVSLAVGTYDVILYVTDNNYDFTADYITITVTDPAPTVPGDLTLNSKDESSVTLNFGTSSYDVTFDTYKIYYKQGTSSVTESDIEHADSDLAYIDYNGTSNTVITGLDSNTSYVFNIWAYDTSGNKVSAANELVVQTDEDTNPPTAPSNLGVYYDYASTTAVMVWWTDNSDDESGFSLERSTDGTNFTEIDTLGANNTFYMDFDIVTGTSTTYYYRVNAYNANGSSDYSNTESALVF